MKFGPVATPSAAGAILAHSLVVDGHSLKKGRVLTVADCALLAVAGRTDVMVAQLEPNDIAEDAAAARIAHAICGAEIVCAPAFTGRCNLMAAQAGVMVIDTPRLLAINSIDESITVATLAPYARVAAGQMVATVKLITFATAAAHVTAVEQLAQSRDRQGLLHIAPFRPARAGLVITTLPGQKESVIRKRETAVRDRLERLGARLDSVLTVAHEPGALAKAIVRLAGLGCDPILVFGASAIVDRGDVVPLGLERAGGRVRHLGMPVDPGNLLMLGELDDKSVIGVPSCAASPKENGFDWVLERVIAGLGVSSSDLTAMAPGGLLMEIETRPQPRQGNSPSGARN